MLEAYLESAKRSAEPDYGGLLYIRAFCTGKHIDGIIVVAVHIGWSYLFSRTGHTDFHSLLPYYVASAYTLACFLDYFMSYIYQRKKY